MYKRQAQSLLSCTRLEKEQREALEQARFLYEVARGDYSGKVNFERYVLAYYFENVIQTANLRLEQMTNSRYTLVRRTQTKGNRTAGLDLDVFDAYTGTARNVDTLSGGESFKAVSYTHLDVYKRQSRFPGSSSIRYFSEDKQAHKLLSHFAEQSESLPEIVRPQPDAV